MIVDDRYIGDRQWSPRWVRTLSLYPIWGGGVKASKPRDRIVTMHMTATSVTFQLGIVLAQVYRMKLEEDQSENVVLLFMQLKHMLWITNISWDPGPTRQQIPKEEEFENKENLLETKKEEGESVVLLKFGRLKQEDNSSCHKNLGDLEEVWLSILYVVTAIAIVTKFKSHPSHLWETDFHFHQCDREISHGNLFFLNSQIRLHTMKLKYATALMILSQYSNHCVNYFN